MPPVHEHMHWSRLQQKHMNKQRWCYHDDESAAGELGTPIDSDREWDGFDDVNPNLSFIVDALAPPCRLNRFTMSCRKSRNSTAYSKPGNQLQHLTNGLKVVNDSYLHSDYCKQAFNMHTLHAWQTSHYNTTQWLLFQNVITNLLITFSRDWRHWWRCCCQPLWWRATDDEIGS